MLAYSAVTKPVEKTYFLNRGNPADKGAELAAGGVAALAGRAAGLRPRG